MDIDLLSRMVKELILDSDEVSLPGVGSFVTELMPATFSDKGYTINPPYRRLYFRQKSGEGDMALANLYAAGNESDGLTPADAQRIIVDFLAEMKTVLQENKTVVFPGLGRLRATKENNFFFVADEDLDIYPAGFALEPISLKTHQETEEEVSSALDGVKAIIEAAGEILPSEEKVPYSAPDSAMEEVPAVESAAPQDTGLQPEEVAEFPDEVPAQPAEEMPEPIAEEVSEPLAEEEEPEQPSARKNTGRIIVLTVLCLVIFALVLLIGFMIAVRVAPDWVDTLLYNAEELELIHSSGL